MSRALIRSVPVTGPRSAVSIGNSILVRFQVSGKYKLKAYLPYLLYFSNYDKPDPTRKKTLLKGWILGFIISFPFTFLPVITGDGDFLIRIINRIPWSLLYAAGFSTALCMAAVVINYDRQRIKLKMINTPAFKSLNSKMILSGKGSLSEDLSFFLKVNHGIYDYFVDINVDLEDHQKKEIIISPDLPSKEGIRYQEIIRFYRDLLRKEFKLGTDKNRLEIMLKPDEINLEDPLGISKQMSMIESKLSIKPVFKG